MVQIAKSALPKPQADFINVMFFFFFENTVCTPASPSCFSLSLSNLTNHLPAFCCINLVTHLSGTTFSKEFSPYWDHLSKRRVFEDFFYYFPFFFLLKTWASKCGLKLIPAASVWGFGVPRRDLPWDTLYSHGCPQPTCSLARLDLLRFL